MDTLTVIGMNIGVIAVLSRFPLSAVAAGEETPKQVRLAVAIYPSLLG